MKIETREAMLNMKIKMKAPAVIVALLLASTLAACTGTGAETQAEESASSAEVAETSAPAIPTVSVETTCTLSFGSNVDGPVPKASDIITRFVSAPDLSTVTEEELDSTITSLEAAAKNADPTIKPYIEAHVTPLAQLLDAKRSVANSEVDFADYKAAGLELINQCTPYL